MSGVRLSGLFLYPVKSLRGVAAASAEVDSIGIVGDRRFMVVDEQGGFLTQRTQPRMATVKATLSQNGLELSAEGRGCVPVPFEEPGGAGRPLRKVSIWKDEGLFSEDCGDGPATWLAEVLGVPCRLVRIGRQFSRPILPEKMPDAMKVSPSGLGMHHSANFADAYPFLIIGKASLDDLNQRLISIGEPPLPMDRFRPNLVITGSPPFAEDTWKRIRIGSIVFCAAGPCRRCVVTTTDQWTGDRGAEPLRTLATYRRDPARPTYVNFGQNLIHETKTGTLHVGDPVEVLA